jgi:hypothetical protein
MTQRLSLSAIAMLAAAAALLVIAGLADLAVG